MRNVIYVGGKSTAESYNTAELMLLGENVDDAILTQAKKQVNCHDVVNMQYTSGTTTIS